MLDYLTLGTVFRRPHIPIVLGLPERGFVDVDYSSLSFLEQGQILFGPRAAKTFVLYRVLLWR